MMLTTKRGMNVKTDKKYLTMQELKNAVGDTNRQLEIATYNVFNILGVIHDTPADKQDEGYKIAKEQAESAYKILKEITGY